MFGDKEEDNFDVGKKDKCVLWERWDKRLLLGSGWLYKQDLKIKQLRKQQGAIVQYLDTINKVLFCRTKGHIRGWTSEKEHMEKLEWEA